ncbi:anoctamin-2 isoform X2 [Stomoxys calcitrans]|uniref:anoctamin-2 isoform X2 n=1 Tax=Stomoxys calcitrans TaxID=35570 RepID=UPI0027E2E0F6|nr:anoctamin-2 isoform X2 [Stomoxys calcitrans]
MPEVNRHFEDRVHGVDFVLAYYSKDQQDDRTKKRKIFEANLIREGLQLEYDKTQDIHFVKIHSPKEVLYRYAEVLKIKLPMKRIPGQSQIYEEDNESSDSKVSSCWKLFQPIQNTASILPCKQKRIYAEFQMKYEQLFDCDQPDFFDAGTRIFIINFILERQHFVEGEETPNNLGIEKLLNDKVYASAYALHDKSNRELLVREWSDLANWKHFQPLDEIKEYFGAKVAIYYAWLGFYTRMLIPLSIFGILFFLYGFITWHSDPISKEICNTNKTTLMCPQCDRNCDYWELSKICKTSKINYLLDNNMTVVFAFFVSMWAVINLELWKRYSADIIHRWGLTGYTQDVEHPRPQYLQKLRNNVKFSKKLEKQDPESVFEPEVPFWSIKFLPSFTSYSIVVLSICVSLMAVFAMVIYRMAQKASRSVLGDENSTTYKVMTLPITASIIYFVAISILHHAYSFLARILTNLEYCRTQTEYDESLTIKIYVFQFVNYYSSLFYVAFLKGKFVGYPMKYNRIFGFRQEECAPGGCLMELCLQLVVIMVGKQLVYAIIEVSLPYLMRILNKCLKNVTNIRRNSQMQSVKSNQWTEDYYLQPWAPRMLFAEYLEIALINNIFEIRTDAMKMLKFIRRPVAQRAKDIGVWFSIMMIVTKIAVATSAVIIAYSTNLIPKMVYRLTTHDDTLKGYLNFTLAYFNTKDFLIPPVLGDSKYGEVTTCRYTEFRNPPDDTHPYKRPMVYWKIFMARLAFIVIYQNVIGIIQTVIAWAIPDVSAKLVKRIKRENFLLREYIIEYEKRQVMMEQAEGIADLLEVLQDDSDT